MFRIKTEIPHETDMELEVLKILNSAFPKPKSTKEDELKMKSCFF